jgi:glycyl-tRNA synthetase beta chain
MSVRDLLLEIGVEEMPARFVEGARTQLADQLSVWLKENRIPFGLVHSYATPRRLAVVVQNMAETQEDQVEVARGPAKQIALDESGQWTKAALGFARSQQVEVDQLYIDEYKGTEYVFVKKERKGKATRSLLPGIKTVIEHLTFPKQMRWGSQDFSFVRPIRWLVALYGEEIIPFEIAGIQAGNLSRGHRFRGGEFTVSTPKEYLSKLNEQYVMIDPEARKKSILDQLKVLEKEQNWRIPVDQDLLDEVVNLVEYPTVIWGQFDEVFLELPDDVLITSMKEHQRYFPVKSLEGKLLPYFVTVTNGNEDAEGIVAKGNEKVLRARLSDARFFFEEDKKLNIDAAVRQLEKVVYHQQLGSMADKMRRVQRLALALANLLEMDKTLQEKLVRAVQICKFDLVSHMVYEFPELEGRMGEVYARLAGEDEEVAQAIYEHYLPRYSGDDVPKSMIGAVLAIADKLDALSGFFGLGLIPSGSQDPYALRRQATGLVAIIIEHGWTLAIDQLVELALNVLAQDEVLFREKKDVKDDVLNFIYQRLKYRMQQDGLRYDIIEAVLGASDHDLLAKVEKGQVLNERLKDDNFKSQAESLIRVTNIARKLDRPPSSVKESLLKQNEERELSRVYQTVHEKIAEGIVRRQWDHVMDALLSLKEPIDHFFEAVMVMVEDEQLRYNRLNLLAQMAQDIYYFADFGQLVFQKS